MKKLCMILLVLAMVCACASAHEIGTRMMVDHCKEYITLREDPSTKANALDRMPLGADNVILLGETDRFAHVSYNGQRGYALMEYLEPAEVYSGEDYTLGKRERYSLNAFLSMLSQQYFAVREGAYCASSADSMLVDFGINYIWFNQNDTVQWGEWGENNVCIPVDAVTEPILNFFGRLPENKESRWFETIGDYYYWQETGGHVNDGFTVVDRVEKMDDNRYSIYFSIYGSGDVWPEGVHDLTAAKARQQFWRDADGHALINTGAGSLLKTDTWTIESYAVRIAE